MFCTVAHNNRDENTCNAILKEAKLSSVASKEDLVFSMLQNYGTSMEMS